MILGLNTVVPSFSVGMLSEAMDGGDMLIPSSKMEDLALEIQSLCDVHSFSLDSISGISVLLGPGPYTSLRLGVTVAKTLSHALSVPVKGYSSLDAQLWPEQGLRGLVFSLLPARKGEVNVAVYGSSDVGIDKKTAEFLAPIQSLSQWWGDMQGEFWVLAPEPLWPELCDMGLEQSRFLRSRVSGIDVARAYSERDPESEGEQLFPRYAYQAV